MGKVYTLSLQVYRNTYTEDYQNIIVINMVPDGPLRNIVRRVQTPILSPFETPTDCRNKRCALVLIGSHGCFKNNYMTEDDIPNLFSFLTSNGYTIDTSVTKMMTKSGITMNDNKLICFISY